MDSSLDSSTVAVTGASRGIGNAIASRFASAGANLSICARSPDVLEDAAATIEREHGVECLAVPADLREEAEARAFVRTTVSHFDGLDVLVNNAGDAPSGGLDDVSRDDFADALALKLLGYYTCIQEAMPHLVDASGAVVNVTGQSGAQPGPSLLATGSTNAAITNLTRALAKGYGRDGVRVNAVSPGSVRTERWDDVAAGMADALALSTDDATTLAERSISMGRLARPEDVASVVVWLASDEAGFVTGASIPVDGSQQLDQLDFETVTEMAGILTDR